MSSILFEASESSPATTADGSDARFLSSDQVPYEHADEVAELEFSTELRTQAVRIADKAIQRAQRREPSMCATASGGKNFCLAYRLA